MFMPRQKLSQKKQVIAKLFEHCLQNEEMTFHNDLVEKMVIDFKFDFKNKFDATKIDNVSLLPQILIDNNYFIIHLGKGYHRFVKGIQLGYHEFEPIESNEIVEWPYHASLLNQTDTSESTFMSVINNQRILHHFLYNGQVEGVNPYGSRRTTIRPSYRIGDILIIQDKPVQIEIDFTTEYKGVVTAFEGKNRTPPNFAIYQLFFPFLYYRQKMNEGVPIKAINCCYVLRTSVQSGIIKMYYTFDDPERMDSIRLLKKAAYRLVKD
jgi:hypothetical protein